MSQPISQPAYERSTLYYLPGCDLIMTSLFSNIIYGVRGAVACERSPLIRDLLEAGRAANPLLGKSDDCPLVLPYGKADVELLLCYCHLARPSHLPELSFSELCRLVYISKELGTQELRDHVIRTIRMHPSFPLGPIATAKRIKLAMKCGVKDWFLEAFELLLIQPLTALSNDELDLIGVDVIHHLISHRHEMEQANVRALVTCPLYVRDMDCRHDPRQCKQAWELFWSKIFAPAALANDAGISTQLIKEHTIDRREGLCWPCMSRNMVLLASSWRCDRLGSMAAASAQEIAHLIFDEVDGKGAEGHTEEGTEYDTEDFIEGVDWA